MRNWSSRYGTMTRQLGYVGQSAADTEDAEQGYWMSVNGPVAMGTAPMNPQGEPSFWQSMQPFLTQTLPTLAERGVALKQSMDVAELNRQLILAGKAPLTATQIAQLQPGVRFGLATDTQQMLMYGGLALLGVYLISSLMKR